MVLNAQEERNIIRKGNQLYGDEKFEEAEIQYRRALEGNSRDHKALFNLGNSLYRQQRFEEAAEIFRILAQSAPEEKDKASAWHNLGNSYVGSQQIAEGIDAYKNALRIDPKSIDSRHNLAYAKQLLEEQPPEEQQQEGDDQGDEDQEQEQPEQQPQTGDEQQPQEQQPQPQPDKISAKDAERILDALNQQEQKIQEELNKEEKRGVPARVEREW